MPPPVETLDFEPCLRKWVADRVPALGGRVYPFTGVQDTQELFCCYQRTKGVRIGDQDGPDGLSMAAFQVDCYARRRQDAKAASDLICGTPAAPGLAGFRGLMAWPSYAGLAVWVQRVDHADESETDFDPEQGEERGWVRVTRDYTVWFEETLRESP